MIGNGTYKSGARFFRYACIMRAFFMFSHALLNNYKICFSRMVITGHAFSLCPAGTPI